MRHLRAIVRQMPEMREASAQWPFWVLRRLLLPMYAIPLTLTSRSGVRYALGDDPVDDSIVRHLHGPGRDLYFPPLASDPAGGIVLDVGAHHGVYAMEALRRYPRCQLIAVEPDPAACLKIEANAQLNHVTARIEIVCAGLADADGRGWLEPDGSGSWGNRTRSDVRTRPARAGVGPGGRGPGSKNVALMTLAAILRGRQPAIVKCNAEGAEFALVPQLLALGHRPQLIVLMAHPEAGSPHDLVAPLRDAGYRVIDADDPPRGYRFHCFLKRAD